jgi:peroxiredoxin Q/BCP
MSKLSEGNKAPYFELPDDDGNTVKLSDYKGKTFVLYFYPADDTPGCTTEACQFSELITDFAKLSIDVLGVSPDNQDSHRRFREKHDLKIRLATDEDAVTATAYGAYGEKNLYGKKTIGTIRSTFVIDGSQNIAKAFYNVRANGHAEKVLKAIVEISNKEGGR